MEAFASFLDVSDSLLKSYGDLERYCIEEKDRELVGNSIGNIFKYVVPETIFVRRSENRRVVYAQSKKLWEGFQKKNQELAAGGNAPISLGEYVDQYVPDSEMKDIFVAKYSGQTRIIPSDQMEEAVKYLEGKIDKLSQDSGRKKR